MICRQSLPIMLAVHPLAIPQPSVPMPVFPDVKLDATALANAQEIFLTREAEFGDFTETNSRHYAEERAYKDEVRHLFARTITPQLFRSDAGSPWEVIKAVQHVLTTRLEAGDGPQNIIGWRYQSFLRGMNEVERMLFARSFGELLYGQGESPEKVERFIRTMWPTMIRVSGQKNPYALTRIFPTFFLMLQDPARDIAVRTDLFSRSSRMLLGSSILQDQPFDAETYRHVLAFSNTVQRALMSWGWCPRDLIDVHSFLWTVSRTDEEFRMLTAGSPYDQRED